MTITDTLARSARRRQQIADNLLCGAAVVIPGFVTMPVTRGRATRILPQADACAAGRGDPLRGNYRDRQTSYPATTNSSNDTTPQGRAAAQITGRGKRIVHGFIGRPPR